MNKLNSDYINDYSSPYSKLDWNDQPVMYPGELLLLLCMLGCEPFTHSLPPCFSVLVGYCMTTPPTTAIMYEPAMTVPSVHHSPSNNTSPITYHQQHPGSPDSFTSIPTTPPIQGTLQEPPVLVQSSSTSTQSSLNETIAKVSSLPEAFYPEFLQYSKESYEQSAGRHGVNRKRKASPNTDDQEQPRSKKHQQHQLTDNEDDSDENG